MALKKFSDLTESEFDAIFRTPEDGMNYLCYLQINSLVSSKSKCPDCGKELTLDTLKIVKSSNGRPIVVHRHRDGANWGQALCGHRFESSKLMFSFTDLITKKTRERDEKGERISKTEPVTFKLFDLKLDNRILGLFKITWAVVSNKIHTNILIRNTKSENWPTYNKRVDSVISNYWVNYAKSNGEEDEITRVEFLNYLTTIFATVKKFGKDFMGVVKSDLITSSPKEEDAPIYSSDVEVYSEDNGEEIPETNAPTTQDGDVVSDGESQETKKRVYPVGTSFMVRSIYCKIYDVIDKKPNQRDILLYKGYLAAAAQRFAEGDTQSYNRVLHEMPGFEDFDHVKNVCENILNAINSPLLGVESLCSPYIKSEVKAESPSGECKLILSTELDEIYEKSPKKDFNLSEYFWTIKDFIQVVKENLGYELTEEQVCKYFESKLK